MWLIAYALIGAVIGFLAGLLGIGGGMSLVPVLAALFTAQGLAADHTVHLALLVVTLYPDARVTQAISADKQGQAS